MERESETKMMTKPPSCEGHKVPAAPEGSSGPGCSRLVVLAAVAASLSGLMMGYELGLTSGVLLQLRLVLSLSCQQQELLVGSVLMGSLAACLAGGPILDRYGRRLSLLLSAALVAGGSLLLAAVTSLAALALGRVVVGMGTALSATAACLYLAEIAPRERRGLLVTLFELMLVVGVMLGFGCSYAFAHVQRGWAFTFGLVVAPALLQVGALLLLPPSPRFLVARGHAGRARAVLARIRGGAGEQVEAELREIQAGLKEEAEHGYAQLLSGRANLRSRLLTGMTLAFFTQATGQPNILSYASPLLRSVGFRSDAAATLASTGFGVVKVVCTVPAVLLVDKVGPKKFLCVGAVAMALTLAALGTITAQSHTQLNSLCRSHSALNHSHAASDLGGWAGAEANWTLGGGEIEEEEDLDTWGSVGETTPVEVSASLKWASLISLLVYVAAFSISLGPMAYVVFSEIFPTGVRGKAVSVVSAVNWATNLLISMTFLTITEKIGLPNVMFLHAAMSFALLVFVILCIPETKGRTLEEISKELAKKKPFKVPFFGKKKPPSGPQQGLVNGGSSSSTSKEIPAELAGLH